MSTETEVEAIDVNLDEAPPAKTDEKQKPEDGKKPEVEVRTEITPDEGIEKLRTQLAEEQQRTQAANTARVEAERQAQEARATATRATASEQDANLQLVNGMIEKVKQANEVLKTQYREARAANDIDAEWKAQEALAGNAADLRTLEAGKKQLEDRAKNPPQVSDPVEAVASKLTPRSAEWVRGHREYVTDAGKNRQMIQAHYKALGEGLAQDSDAYFQSIEQTLGLRQVETQTDDDEPAPPKQKPRSAPPAAPPSRSGGGNGSAGNPRIVRLTAEEREVAASLGMSDKDYALNKVALEKEGRLGRPN